MQLYFSCKDPVEIYWKLLISACSFCVNTAGGGMEKHKRGAWPQLLWSCTEVSFDLLMVGLLTHGFFFVINYLADMSAWYHDTLETLIYIWNRIQTSEMSNLWVLTPCGSRSTSWWVEAGYKLTQEWFVSSAHHCLISQWVCVPVSVCRERVGQLGNGAVAQDQELTHQQLFTVGFGFWLQAFTLFIGTFIDCWIKMIVNLI